MNISLEYFLLFDLRDWVKYGDKIISFCKYAVFPISVFSLLFNQLAKKVDPEGILKKAIIAQVILIFLPVYFTPVVGFGLDTGNAILKEQRGGLISSWRKFEKRAIQKLKKKELSAYDTAIAFFKFDGADFVEKLAMLTILVCMLLLKVIYSGVYYITYSTAAIMAVLSILPNFDNHVFSILKTMLYLIVCAVLVALVLSFMNSVLDFKVSRDGFIVGLSGISQFIVLCIVLLATLKISQSMINGAGAENWAASMGNNLSAGLAYKAMTLPMDTISSIASKSFSSGGNLLKSTAAVSAPVFSGMTKIAKKPFSSAYRNIKDSIKSDLSKESEQIAQKRGIELNPEKLGGENSSIDNSNTTSSDNRYDSSFRSIASDQNGKVSISSALNPVNHLKASIDSSKRFSSDMINLSKDRAGLPLESNSLSLKEKTIFMANKGIGNAHSLSKNDQLKNQILSNRINKIMEDKNDRES